MKKERLKQLLQNPGKEYRSAPFWGVNDRLEEEELRCQIREMKQAGMGGFFLHSREGLETPYLSQEWMEACAQSLDEAKRQDLEVWIYDEDKWPSGMCGGFVSKADPARYTARGITLEVLPPEEAGRRAAAGLLIPDKEYPDGKILGVYAARILDGEILSLRRISAPEDLVPSGTRAAAPVPPADPAAVPEALVPPGEQAAALVLSGARAAASVQPDDLAVAGTEQVLILRREISGSSEWYNGYAPSDNLNPRAVQEFLHLTHHQYEAHFAKEFGRQIRGFFTDEPNCCDFYACFTKGRPWLTWTEDLLDYFEKKRGYNPLDMLPYLFYKGEPASGLRHDFWWTITEKFQESYMKQIYTWCEDKGVEFTGHVLYENDLGYQSRVCGSAMAQYKYLHRPGIDILGEQTREYLTVKQCTSVANQYGRAHTITETYGCTGWEFDYEGQKWLGNWQFVMGINRRCQHLAQYSITGCRKRDYPPVFGYQATGWCYNRRMEDYFARISAAVSQGRVVRDVMVLHPMTSVWAMCGSTPEEDLNHIEMNMGWLDDHITALNEWGEEYNRLAQMLLGAHIDFDFGDEVLLSQDGKAGDGVLQMGICQYKTVIVPGVCSILNSTGKLLKKFACSGGRILFVEPLPVMLEGVKAPELAAELLALPGVGTVESFEKLLDELNAADPSRLHIRTREGQEDTDLLCMLRKDGDQDILFVINNDRTGEHVSVVEYPACAQVTVYDPWTDSYEEPAVERTREGGMRFICRIPPAGSRILLLDPTTRPVPGKLIFPYRHPHYTDPVFAVLGPVAKVCRTMENVLTLDTCRYRLAKDAFSEEMQVWQAQRAIRETLKMPQIYYNGAPQRYTWLDQTFEKDGTPFALAFTFTVEEVPEGPVYAVVEKADHLTISLNGTPCRREAGYFIDRKMYRFRLPDMEKGEQTLMISGAYRHEMELEDVYIIGDFGVNQKRQICRENGKLHFGDWCLQGYYHYPGSMKYEFTIPGKTDRARRYILRMGEYRGTLAVVRLNGQIAGYLTQKSGAELDITEYMGEDAGTLEIEIVGSPRNMFGPFHQKYTGCSRISWADFRTEGDWYTPDYVLEPYGIYGQITVVMLPEKE